MFTSAHNGVPTKHPLPSRESYFHLISPPQIVHLNHGLVKKLEAQISNLQRELEEQGQRLGTSQATAELLHLKETAMDVQLSQLKGAMVKV